MMNRKTIMFLALLGTYAAQASETVIEEGYVPSEYPSYTLTQRPARVRPSEEESIGYMTRETGEKPSYLPIQRPARVMPSEEESIGTITKKETAKSEKAKIEDSLKNAEKEGGAEMLCSVAARFGRSLKVLPKSKGPISKEKLAKKCNKFFQENGHPKAYEAVNGKQMAS